MYTSPVTLVVLLLSAFHVALAASDQPAAKLEVRQAPIAQPDTACLDYETTANLSVIGTNSSYRSIYLARSSFGGLVDQRMFKEKMAALPALTADTALNQRCGNKTEIALAGAESNLTQGIVGPFTNVVASTIKNGYEIVIITGTIILTFVVVWIFSP